MRILVTGAGGYVGSTLVERLLDDGHVVVGTDNFFKGHCDTLIPFIKNPRFEFANLDVCDVDQVHKHVKDADYIIHLASIVGAPACERQKALAKIVNEEGSKNIAQAVKAYGKNLVFASTGSVYGVVEGVQCTEDIPAAPQSLYGETKMHAESKIRALVPHAIIYRFATGFGVGNSMRVNLLVNDLVWQAMTNNTLTIFESSFWRTFIHVRDMASSFAFAVQNYDRLQHRLYNVGDDSLNATKKQIVEMIRETTNCHVCYAEVGKDSDVRNYSVDYTRFRLTGWRPQVTLESGIAELKKVVSLLRIRSPYN